MCPSECICTVGIGWGWNIDVGGDQIEREGAKKIPFRPLFGTSFSRCVTINL